MNKISKLKILLVVFLTLIISIVAGCGVTYALDISNDKDLANAAQDANTWYNFNASELVGQNIGFNAQGESDATISQSTAFCIDHYGIYKVDFGTVGNYYIRNIIDIDTGTIARPGTVTIYGKNDQEETFTKTVNTQDSEGGKASVELAYLAAQAFMNNEVGFEYGIPNKAALQHRFAYRYDLLRETLGFDWSLQPSGPVGEYYEEYREYEEAAENYAENTKKYTFEDASVKGKQTVEFKNGKSYVGPYKINIEGCNAISIIATIGDKTLSAIGFSSEFGGEIDKIENIKSNIDFYAVFDGEIDTIDKIVLKSNKVEVYKARLVFLRGGDATQNLIIYRGEAEDKDFEFELPKIEYGSLEIIKKDKTTNDVLPNISFKVYSQKKQAWLKSNSPKDDPNAYTTNESEAMTFVTGATGSDRGKFTIKGLPVGKYNIKETSVGDLADYYELPKEWIISDVKVTGGVVKQDIINAQKYIKLSGYVWLDKIDGKQSLRNDKYHDSDYDTNDTLLQGITVKLKDSSNNTIAITTTDKNGAYIFNKVEIENISKYYVEFEYDGVTYTNVASNVDADNGSKASESSTVRDNFNSKFSVIAGTGVANQGVALDRYNEVSYVLEYERDLANHKSTLKTNNTYKIQASTDQVQKLLIENIYKKLSENYTKAVKEIPYINLGLYEREQPDIALMKDIYNVKLSINGYNHVYTYNQRTLNAGEYGDGFNVGVKFGEKYGKLSYSRPVYKSDIDYKTENGTNELKAYINYKITIKNESTNLIAQVYSLVDFYDSNYTLIKAGTTLDEQGNIKDELKTNNSQENAQTYIDTSSLMIGSQKSVDVYVQFELNRNAILKTLNNKENLNNVVEINSYATYSKDGKIYAGVDKDSAPSNCISASKETYEDDTDSAPSLLLEVADNAREMAGKVFLDTTSGTIKVGEERRGSGAYEEGEIGISGVAVTLKENSTGKEYTATTDENGDFKLIGFIPGDYTLIYTWGDETYTVENYKGTIYDSTRDQNNKQWYKVDSDKRLTDAIDNYTTRQAIDNESKEITKMNSSTPVMSIGVEYETTTTASKGDKYTYQINNIDFGIVERARQQIALDKRVKTMKVTLANGQVITELEIDENGNVTGTHSGVQYVKPSEQSNPKNGLLKLDLDNELIEGSKLEVTYEIKAINNSEIDYISEDYYKYGIAKGEKVTLTPGIVIDYLDNNWSFDKDKNDGWIIKTADEIKDLVVAEVFDREDSTIKNKTILYTENLSKELKPTESISSSIYVSKLLSNQDEIYLDNEAEVVKIKKTGGAFDKDSKPGNYVPGTGITTDPEEDMAETVIVTNPTGSNLDFIVPTLVGITTLIILASGVFIIKKKVLNK